MKMFKIYYNKKERAQLVFNLIIYIIFVGFTISLAFQQDSWIETSAFIIMLVFFLTFSLLNDYLTYLYKVSIHQLTIKCDPSLAFTTVSKLKKLDLFKSYKLSVFMLTCLVYLDSLQMNEAINYVTQTNTQLKHKDKAFMSEYVLFRANAYLNETKQMKVHYEKLKELRNMTIKGRRVSPLFSFEDVEGCYHLAMNEPKEAWLDLQRSNTNVMNPRELIDHYSLRIKCELKLDNLSQAKHYLNSFPVVNDKNNLIVTSRLEVEEYEASTKHRKSKKTTNPR
jgi:hypothetical protein